MKHLLNTLYVTGENTYLSLDGENVLANREKEVVARFPLHTLDSIVSFSYPGASPALMGACAERGINLSFCTPRGRFLARCVGASQGNVLLRREQYRRADDEKAATEIARSFIFGKVYNARWSIERTKRDHGLRVDAEALTNASAMLKAQLPELLQTEAPDTLRGLEGLAAKTYFDVFDHLILNNKETFFFHGRSRRPPLDPLNALLSFTYSLLANDCAAALEAVGLDSYVGFMHTDRPGRRSLALDLMEELRPCIADRLVLSLVNSRQLQEKDFSLRENGSVLLTEEGRKTFLSAWQNHKRQELTHPYLKEKLPWGLVPHIQAQLLARLLRGDLDAYPPFLWK